MADADAHPAEVWAEARVDRAEAVVPGGSPADLHLHLERREIEFVVEDGKIAHFELVEAHCLLNRVATVVHEGLGLQQQYPLAADASLGDRGCEISSTTARSRAPRRSGRQP